MKGTNAFSRSATTAQLSLLLGIFPPCTLNMLIRRVRESHKVPPMRLNFISYCRLLPPREIAKSFSANGMIGRGGGERIRAPLIGNQKDAATHKKFVIRGSLRTDSPRTL